jgi:hypothetical protein
MSGTQSTHDIHKSILKFNQLLLEFTVLCDGTGHSGAFVLNLHRTQNLGHGPAFPHLLQQRIRITGDSFARFKLLLH